jgi:hypothetical protein
MRKLLPVIVFCLLPVVAWAWGIVGLGGGAPASIPPASVLVTGTPDIDTSYSDGNMSVTIPSDATAVVVVSWMWRSVHAGDFTTINFDAGGKDFTQIVTNSTTAVPYDVWAYIMTTDSGDWPGVGSKTLYWTFSGDPTEGGTVFAFYLKGLNVTSPMVDTDTQKTGSSFTSSLSGVSSGDLSFVVIAEEQGQSITVSGNGQTVLDTGAAENKVDWGIAYEDGEDAVIASSTGSSYPGYIAFSVNRAD